MSSNLSISNLVNLIFWQTIKTLSMMQNQSKWLKMPSEIQKPLKNTETNKTKLKKLKVS